MLFERFGRRCRNQACAVPGGWAEVNPALGYSPVEVDHVDGDHFNNALGNLRILCPSCHSLTPTFRKLNRRAAA